MHPQMKIVLQQNSLVHVSFWEYTCTSNMPLGDAKTTKMTKTVDDKTQVIRGNTARFWRKCWTIYKYMKEYENKNIQFSC